MDYRRGAARLFTVIALGCPVLTPVHAAQTTAYSYDALGRVATVCFVESSRLITYSYDDAGNRTAIATTGTSCAGGTVPPPNQPPVANSDVKWGSYHVNDWVRVNVLANDSDPDGDPLTITAASCISSGCTVTIHGDSLEVTGTSTGEKDITYTISDGRGGTDTSTLIVGTYQYQTGCGRVEFC